MRLGTAESAASQRQLLLSPRAARAPLSRPDALVPQFPPPDHGKIQECVVWCLLETVPAFVLGEFLLSQSSPTPACRGRAAEGREGLGDWAKRPPGLTRQRPAKLQLVSRSDSLLLLPVSLHLITALLLCAGMTPKHFAQIESVFT